MSDELTRQQIYAKGLAQTVIDEHGLEDQLFEADLRSLFRTLEKLFTAALEQGRSEREKEIIAHLETKAALVKPNGYGQFLISEVMSGMVEYGTLRRTINELSTSDKA